MPENLHPLVPAWLLSQLGSGEEMGSTDAAAVLVDVVDFTATTDALATRGDLGAEQLAALLDTVFDPLVATVDSHGGFVSTFSGDGFTGIFPGGADACRRAVSAALAMHSLVASVDPISLPQDTYEPRVRVGVGYGDVDWAIVESSDGQRATYLVRGGATSGAAEAESSGDPDVVTVTEAVAFHLDDDYLRGANPMQVKGGPRLDVDIASAGPSPSPAEAERFYPPEVFGWDRPAEFRQVASVFCNVALHAVEQTLATLFELQQRYGGLLSPPEFGDKGCVVMVLWGAPVGWEDDVARAAGFASDLARAIAGDIRVGVSFGTVFAGFVGSASREQYTCYGSSINLAARLMGKADWGEVLVDADVAGRVEGDFEVESRGEEPLKGFAQTREVFRLGSVRVPDDGPVTRLVGRSSELGALVGLLADVGGTGRGAVALVEGDAGIGKTRLVVEARRRLSPDTRWFVSPSDPRSARSLGPWRRFVELYFGHEATATTTENHEAFRRHWDQLLVDVDQPVADVLEDARSFLQALVDLYEPGSAWQLATPPERAARTSAAVLALLRAAAAVRPLVIELADLQWADEESRELLGRVVEASLPIGLVMTRRPSAEHLPEADLTIRLTPLDRDEIAAVTADALGGAPDYRLSEWLAVRSEGNPFYVQQLLRFLRDRQLLTESEPFRLESDTVEVPTDVRAVVVARLDALNPQVRTAIQFGAILGREFEPAVLELMLAEEVPPVPPGVIAEATRSQLWSRAGAGLYRFDNAMVQEAAYGMQLQATRRQRHAFAAANIEQLHADLLDPHFVSLAFHHEAADNLDDAVHYLSAAGTVALRSGNHHEAGAHAEHALALLPAAVGAGPEMELGLNNILGVSRIATHGQAAPETLAPYQRALELSEKVGETPETFQALFGVRTHFLFTGEHTTAAALAARGLEIAERLEDEDLLLEGHLNVGNSHFWAGEHDDAIRHLGWVVDNYRPDQHHRHLVQFAQNPRITAIFPLAHSLWAVGRTAEAEALVDSTVALAIELEHSFSQALAIQTEAFLRCQLRQPELVEKSATRLIEIAERAGFPVYIPVGNIPLGWARAAKGDPAGRQLTDEASSLLQSSGMGVSRTLFSVLLADAAIATGDIGGAREVAEAAFDWGRRTGEQAFLPELRRLQATASEPTEAVSLLSDAIELASRQGAVSFEFRARVDLAALVASAGRPVEAFGILEPALHMSPPSIAEADRLATLAEDLGERQPDGEDHHVE